MATWSIGALTRPVARSSEALKGDKEENRRGSSRDALNSREVPMDSFFIHGFGAIRSSQHITKSRAGMSVTVLKENHLNRRLVPEMNELFTFR